MFVWFQPWFTINFKIRCGATTVLENSTKTMLDSSDMFQTLDTAVPLQIGDLGLKIVIYACMHAFMHGCMHRCMYAYVLVCILIIIIYLYPVTYYIIIYYHHIFMYTRVNYPKHRDFFQIHHGQVCRARRWKTSWWSWRQWHRTARPSNWHPMLVPARWRAETGQQQFDDLMTFDRG